MRLVHTMGFVLLALFSFSESVPTYAQRRPDELRSIARAMRGDIATANRHAPPLTRMREGRRTLHVGRKYDSRQIQLRNFSINHLQNAELAMLSDLSPDPDDEAWRAEAAIIARPDTASISQALTLLEPRVGPIHPDEAQAVQALVAHLASLVQAAPGLVVVATKCGWYDEPGAVYNGVMLVDPQTHAILWIYVEESWPGM